MSRRNIREVLLLLLLLVVLVMIFLWRQGDHGEFSNKDALKAFRYSPH